MSEIPQSAFVPCPKLRFSPVRVATSCPGCEHFKGFVQVDKNPKATFVEAQRVGCAHPVTRAMIHIEV